MALLAESRTTESPGGQKRNARVGESSGMFLEKVDSKPRRAAQGVTVNDPLMDGNHIAMEVVFVRLIGPASGRRSRRTGCTSSLRRANTHPPPRRLRRPRCRNAHQPRSEATRGPVREPPGALELGRAHRSVEETSYGVAVAREVGVPKSTVGTWIKKRRLGRGL